MRIDKLTQDMFEQDRAGKIDAFLVIALSFVNIFLLLLFSIISKGGG